MKRNLLLAVSLALMLSMVGLFGCSQSNASSTKLSNGLQVNLNAQQSEIWVTGQGETSVTPDIATLRLGVEVQKASVAEAQAEAAEAMNKVTTALKESGVSEEDIQTQYFRIRQRTRWDEEKGEEIVTGYRVTNTVSAQIRNPAHESRPFDYRVSLIIDTVAEAGGDLIRIEGISFSVEDPSGYHEELREKAMADAEAKAKQLADLAGVTLGEATYISEGVHTSVPPWYEMMGGMESVPAPAPAPTSISPGETEISLTIQVAYAIIE